MRDLAAPLPTADESRDARRVRIQFQRVPVAFASREESAQRQVNGGGRSGNGGSGESVEGRAAAERGRGQRVGEEVETRLAAVTVLNTALEGGPGPAQRAVPISGSEEHISCELALTSVGYKSVAVDGAPFDQPCHALVVNADRNSALTLALTQGLTLTSTVTLILVTRNVHELWRRKHGTTATTCTTSVHAQQAADASTSALVRPRIWSAHALTRAL
eukprot:6189245-Pleurochrysis_carterae.AAC.1